MKITRKEFFIKSAQGVAIISLPVIFSSFLESCNQQTTSPNGTAGSPLATLQGALLPRHFSNTLLNSQIIS